MAVNWGLAGEGFDALQSLQVAGQAQQQRLMAQKQQAALVAEQRKQAALGQVSAQVGAGNYGGALTAAVESGDSGLVSSIRALSEDKRRALKEEATGIANLAYSLRGVPQDQRAATAAPVLAQMGVDPAQVQGIDWSDNGLRGYYGYYTDIQKQVAATLGEARVADIGVDNQRADTLAGNTIRNTTARLGFAANADRRGAAASARAAEARNEGRVRFRERDKDRAAIAAGGRAGIRTDLDDLDY